MSDFYSQVVSLPVVNYQLSTIKKTFQSPKAEGKLPSPVLANVKSI